MRAIAVIHLYKTISAPGTAKAICCSLLVLFFCFVLLPESCLSAAPTEKEIIASLKKEQENAKNRRNALKTLYPAYHLKIQVNAAHCARHSSGYAAAHNKRWSNLKKAVSRLRIA